MALVANSIVFLAPDTTRQVHTLPTAAGMHLASLALFPALQHLGNVAVQERVYLPAADLAGLLGVPQSVLQLPQRGPVRIPLHSDPRWLIESDTREPAEK